MTRRSGGSPAGLWQRCDSGAETVAGVAKAGNDRSSVTAAPDRVLRLQDRGEAVREGNDWHGGEGLWRRTCGAGLEET